MTALWTMTWWNVTVGAFEEQQLLAFGNSKMPRFSNSLQLPEIMTNSFLTEDFYVNEQALEPTIHKYQL